MIYHIRDRIDISQPVPDHAWRVVKLLGQPFLHPAVFLHEEEEFGASHWLDESCIGCSWMNITSSILIPSVCSLKPTPTVLPQRRATRFLKTFQSTVL